MNNETNLLPCPFCGAQPEEQDVSEHFVECPSCGIEGPGSSSYSAAGAMAEWNRRATATAAPTQQPAAAAPTVELYGVKDGVKHHLGRIPEPPIFKAREIVRGYFGGDLDDEESDAAMALQCCRDLIAHMQQAASARPIAYMRAGATVPSRGGHEQTDASDPNGFPVYRAQPAQAEPTDAELHAIWQHCNMPTDENNHTTGPVPFARAVLAAARKGSAT